MTEEEVRQEARTVEQIVDGRSFQSFRIPTWCLSPRQISSDMEYRSIQ